MQCDIPELVRKEQNSATKHVGDCFVAIFISFSELLKNNHANDVFALELLATSY